MARYSYPFEVWSDEEVPVAKFRDVYDAVRFLSTCDYGHTIRVARRVVYHQGVDGYAGESFDVAAEVIAERVPSYVGS